MAYWTLTSDVLPLVRIAVVVLVATYILAHYIFYLPAYDNQTSGHWPRLMDMANGTTVLWQWQKKKSLQLTEPLMN